MYIHDDLTSDTLSTSFSDTVSLVDDNSISTKIDETFRNEPTETKADETGETSWYASDFTEDRQDERGETSRYGYAESTFLGFIATSNLYELQSRAGVVFTGLPRVGKSSAVAVQRGSYLIQFDDEDGSSSFHPVSQYGDPKISSSTVATTVNVSLFKDWKNERNIFDTPGLNDNRPKAYKIWSNFSLECTFGLMASIDATCVVIHYSSSFAPGANADTFRDLAYTILSIAGSGPDRHQPHVASNFCFLLTHVGAKATHNGVVGRLETVQLDELKQQVNILKQLKRRFRNENFANKAAAHARNKISWLISSRNTEKEKLAEEIESLRDQIAFENPSLRNDPLYPTLDKIRASVLLIEMMLSSTERIMLCRPSGEEQCKLQREQAEKVFKKCIPLQRPQLRELAESKPIRDFEVYDILANLASKMGKKLKAYNIAMLTYLKSVDEQADVINAVKKNWKEYRDQYVDDIRDEKIKRDKQCVENGKLKERLKTSNVLKTPIRNTYRVCAEWSFWGYVRGTVTHTGTYDVHLLDVQGKFGEFTFVENAEKTEIKVHLSSKLMKGIDAKIHFQHYERDLDDTKEHILELSDEIKKIEEENITRVSDIRTLESFTSDQQLMDFVVGKKMKKEVIDIQKACNELNKKVNTGIFDDTKKEKFELTIPYRSACDALYRLVVALEMESAIPIDIATNWASSTELFKVAYELFIDMEHNFNESKTATKLFDKETNLQVIHPPLPKIDINETKAELTGTVGGTITNMIYLMWTVMISPMLKYMLEHPSQTCLVLGILILGGHLKLRKFATLAILFIGIGITIGGSTLLYEIRRFIKNEIQTIKMDIESRLDELLTEAKERDEKYAALIEEASGELRNTIAAAIEKHIAHADRRWNAHEIIEMAAKECIHLAALYTKKRFGI